MATSAVDSVPLDTAELVGTLIESVCFGLALALGGRTINIVYRGRRNGTYSSMNVIFLIAPVLMLALAAAHVGVDWYRMFAAFLHDLNREQRTVLLELPSFHHYFAKDFLYILQTTLGDSVLAYRAYVVWQKQWWVLIIPVLAIGTAFGLGMYACHLFLTNQLADIFKLQSVVTGYFLLTIITTVICTGMILVRLWMSDRTRKITRSRLTLWPIMAVLFESGFIYCAVVITVYVLFKVGTNAQIIVLNPINSVIVILFSFVLLRIVNPESGAPTSSQNRSANNQSFMFSRPRNTHHATSMGTGNVEITMETFTHKSPGDSMKDSESYEAKIPRRLEEGW